MTNTEYMQAAGEVARTTGAMLRERMGGDFAVGTKLEKHDYVTEIDLASENLVKAEIRKRFPDHKFFGEEEASSDPAKAKEMIASFSPDDYVWFVDPIDGTTNFVRRMPLFCISIALAKGGVVIAAAVMDPTRDELFTAALGAGAFLNGSPVAVTDVGDMADAIVSTSLPTALHAGREQALRNMREIFPIISSTRVINCAALCLVNVAVGRTDAHWEYGLNVWDMAAGALLVTEAGGEVSTMRGEPFSIHADSVIASNGRLHKSLCAAVNS